jgi:hypothetical protein
MTGWIIIGALDVVALGWFRLLGGFGSAADAIKEWGCAAGRVGRCE